MNFDHSTTQYQCFRTQTFFSLISFTLSRLQVEVTKTVCDEFKAAAVKFLRFGLKREYRDVGICLLPKNKATNFGDFVTFAQRFLDGSG